MNLRIITASAGTGKTTRLAQLLDEAVSSGTARPEALLATTFTKQAAAELLNRARTRLLTSGQGRAAQALLASRIGTVNAVCGSLVADFAFELGMSPQLRVLDETSAAVELKRALASVVTDQVSDKLQDYQWKFDVNFDWHYEVQRLVEVARANGLGPDALEKCAERSIHSLNVCFGPVSEAASLDAELRAVLEAALGAIGRGGDSTIKTREYAELLRECIREVSRQRLPWGDWAKLTSGKPATKSLSHAAPVQAVAARHLGHPRLRAEMHDLIRLMFSVASSGLRSYQQLKRDRGLLDFVDQEVFALELLKRDDVREVLKDQLDLVLVDEFQDTSPLQLVIFLRLAELAKQSVWVGDPKQAIFGFRGTDPALMDAAIQSLTNPLGDVELVSAAVSEVTGQRPVETLSRSHRSRPELVHLTNALFSKAFAAQQGMPEAQVRLQPERVEAPELGPAVNAWPLTAAVRMSEGVRAQAVAHGVRSLLAGAPTLFDPHTNDYRAARPADVAVLCRTNDQCRLVSEALGALGLASVVARVGLFDRAEGQVALAGLQLWVDSRDSLAAATLVRLLEHPEAPEDFFAQALSADGRQRMLEHAAVKAVLEARQRQPDLDVVGALDAVLEAVEARRLAASWGQMAQRIANLDALRAHATQYCATRTSCGESPSVVGLLAYLDELMNPSHWSKGQADTVARVTGEDAVTLSTWHAAKGLEWPFVVLYGLESLREPTAHGVHVLTDRAGFDLADPLGGRWVHFWPNPYTNAQQNGPVKAAYVRSGPYRDIRHKAEREALRVLYVGWTRARDRLVLAAEQGKLVKGLLGTLVSIDAGLISEPPPTAGAVLTSWAGHSFRLEVAPSLPGVVVPTAQVPGEVCVGRPSVRYPLAVCSPSAAPPLAGQLGEPARLGEVVRLRGGMEADALGTAVHGFLASDDPDRSAEERLALAAALLERHRVGGAVEPEALRVMGDRLWRWVRATFGAACVWRSEWPLAMRDAQGTVIAGTSDLIVETPDRVAIIDHKSHGLTAAGQKVELLAGQLDCYARVVARARPGKVVSTWVHLPFEGVVVEVTVLRGR